MATARRDLLDMASSRLNLTTIPALLSLLYAWVTMAVFGGTPMPKLTWLSYKMPPVHGAWLTVIAYVIAFASSETDDWRKYNRGEQVLITAGPFLTLGNQYVPVISDALASAGVAGGFAAWLLSMIGWGVLIR